MASGFYDKLVSRVDRLDAGSLQAQFARLAQERGFLETIFQAIQEGIIVIDKDACLVYANHAAEQFVGFEFDKQRGRPVQRWLRDWDWEGVADLAADHKNGWNRVVTREVEITYPTHRFISFYAFPVRSTQNADENETVLILRDVTRERANEESTIESEKINAIKLLAAGVAHEIGNPLNALNIHLQLLTREIKSLQDTASRENLAELAGVASAEVARLDAIISQFLQAIRPSKPVLQPDRLDDVLHETLRVLQTDIENRQIKVALTIQEMLPEVPIDRQQMKQVFFNLIKNAMDATVNGGQIVIDCAADDVWVTVTIADTGCGIPQEQLGQIFEPYHTTKKNGNGLGLMIVQRIIQDHGGEIDVVSKVDEGTRMTLRLPRVERRVRQLKG